MKWQSLLNICLCIVEEPCLHVSLAACCCASLQGPGCCAQLAEGCHLLERGCAAALDCLLAVSGLRQLQQPNISLARFLLAAAASLDLHLICQGLYQALTGSTSGPVCLHESPQDLLERLQTGACPMSSPYGCSALSAGTHCIMLACDGVLQLRYMC